MDLDAIGFNYRSIRERLGGSRKILGVVKADAYGHGAVAVARRLEAEGIDVFGVAMVEEGLELRRAGIRTPILILGAFDASQIPEIAEGNLTPMVYSMTALTAILEAGRRLPHPIPFHLKIDTGMGRLGFTAQNLGAALDRIAALPQPALEGVGTTLAISDQAGNPFTRDQVRRFSQVLEEIRRRGLRPGTAHMSNSGGVLNSADTWFDMVRPGLALYGLGPSDAPPNMPLKPALSLHTRVILLKSVPSGTPLGYGGEFRTSGPSRIATIAAGYDDGIDRRLHDGGEVLIRGKRAPFAGRISMDLAMVDVTALPEAAELDQATIIGTQGTETISASDLARTCGTIAWEILCGIGARVPRVYLGEDAPDSPVSRFDIKQSTAHSVP